jgi:hypothetical protein
MRRQLTIGGTAVAIVAAASCGLPQPQIGQPGYCGQTQDGKAVVALHVDLPNCPAGPGQLRISVYNLCGPILQGSDALGDCWRGNVPGIPSPDVFRLDFIQAHGGQAINIVASDATAT